MFINLSNHLSNNWHSTQREAAEVYGEIVDLAFPHIDPLASEAEVLMIAHQYLSQCLDHLQGLASPHAVHVMGEMTFTFALVALLQAKEVLCVAATSNRLVEMNPDGSKTARFVFAQFRPYTPIR